MWEEAVKMSWMATARERPGWWPCYSLSLVTPVSFAKALWGSVTFSAPMPLDPGKETCKGSRGDIKNSLKIQVCISTKELCGVHFHPRPQLPLPPTALTFLHVNIYLALKSYWQMADEVVPRL